jgi:FtsP/CotA-like multicopper oxidase with cupredoxin domain
VIVLVALLACRPPEESDPAGVIDTDTDAPPDTDDTDVAAPRPAFVSPAEAVDLDPDPNVLHVELTAFEYSGRYAYNFQIPGPTLRAKVGDTLIVDLNNGLDQPTTVHWHGLDVPWEMDGITWMQAPIEPGASKTYTFPLTRAGTYWYHPHFDDGRQADFGLYGVIVVEDPAEPRADVEIVAVLDTWGESDDDTGGGRRSGEDTDPHGGGGDGHGAVLPEWDVNDLTAPVLSVPAGSTVRARIVNVANLAYVDLRGPGRLVARDQGLLAAEGVAEGLVMGPGDRAEIEWTVGADPIELSTAPWSLFGGAATGLDQALIGLVPEGEGTAPDPLPFVFSGAAPTADPGYADIVWVLQGEGDTWLINGEAWPDVTIPEVALGATAIVELRNISGTEHPFHLHGMPFEVLSVDGAAPAVKTMEDTINLPIRSTVRLRVHATNPGDWMAHCHIPSHAHIGMMTVLRVNP